MRAKTWTGAMMMAAAVALVAAAVVTSAGAREEAREIRLVARGMTFYLDADPTAANPTIRVRRGERVRFMLRNETPGIDHDLAIASMGVGLTPVAVGQSAAFDLQAPDQPGRHEYACRPHAVMMKGVVEIQ
jgi:plastocyanin